MKQIKKIIALVLVAAMLMLTLAVPAMASTKLSPNENTGDKLLTILYGILEKLMNTILKALNMLMPGLNWNGTWPKIDNYEPTDFYAGETSFDTSVYDNSKWSVGYSSASLLDGLDILNGNFYMAGTLEPLESRAATQIVDDQRVNVFAISDGVSGTVIQAVIDGYGICRGDVLEIRSRLADFAAEHNIIGMNISVLHQHSCIDILGLGAALLPALVKNPLVTLTKQDSSQLVEGKNAEFMNNLYEVVSTAMETAVNNMSEGSLYYGNVDVSQYIHDKREPIAFDGNMNRIRFVPDDATENEIWICEAGIHCVGLGASASEVSGDFPYYLREYVKEQTGADVVYVQGAELAITAEYANLQYEDTAINSGMKAMGEALGSLIIGIDNDVELAPVLNVTMTELTVKADNEILKLAVRQGLLNSVVATDKLDLDIVTEVGYMELGNQIGILLAPGELAAEILWGGATTAEDSWTKESWDYAPLEQVAGVKLLCFGLNNDQIGYVLTDNDYRSIFTENEEIIASCSTSGSAIAQTFIDMIAAVK